MHCPVGWVILPVLYFKSVLPLNSWMKSLRLHDLRKICSLVWDCFRFCSFLSSDLIHSFFSLSFLSCCRLWFLPFFPLSRPFERESLRKLRHSLGCFSTLVPWAEKTSLQPLTLQQPDPTSCFIPCSERIHVAVTEMAALFPKKPKSEMVRASLRLLTSSAYRLQSECKKTLPGESGPTADIQLVTQQVIQCAYDIAKAAKQLVTITTKENNN
nr:PREDICTED: uncharacterized protein LOC106704141 [Latimeria chalumnae]|eukprot:XP_014345963.1 PREDICTED: uncharacterized protein LOC106704141 [Latimeria chalumnae]